MGKKGVSTLIGITLFILLVGVLVGYSFIWTQNASRTSAEVMSEIDFENQRAAEVLSVLMVNNQTLKVTNPTNLAINITQIWNSSHNVNETIVELRPSNSIMITGLSSDGSFKIVTERGNIFYSTPLIEPVYQPLIPNPYLWNLTFWASNSTTINSTNTYVVGNALIYDLSFTYRTFNDSWGPNVKWFGFNATGILNPLINKINVRVNMINSSYSGNQITISVNDSAYLPVHFNSSNFTQFNFNPNYNYTMEINFVTNTTSTVTVTIEGADFA